MYDDRATFNTEYPLPRNTDIVRREFVPRKSNRLEVCMWHVRTRVLRQILMAFHFRHTFLPQAEPGRDVTVGTQCGKLQAYRGIIHVCILPSGYKFIKFKSHLFPEKDLIW